MNTLLAAIASFFSRLFSDAIAGIVKDWRRDRALVEKGEATADAKANAATAEAERRAAAVPVADDEATIDKLERGEF